MSAAKHTPGKWSVQYDGMEIRSDNGTQVCAMTPENGGRYTRTIEETEANARLIAAAPELLAACKAMLEADSSLAHLVQESDAYLGAFGAGIKRVVASMISAIAKAEMGKK